MEPGSAIGTGTTIDSGVVVQGYGSVTDNGQSRGYIELDNKGTIDANVSGQTLTADPHGFVNEATAEATNGGTLDIGGYNSGYYANMTWINAVDGTISATNSTLNLSDVFTNAGTITATGSTVDLGTYYDEYDYGYWQNTGTISVTGGSLTLGSSIFTPRPKIAGPIPERSRPAARR